MSKIIKGTLACDPRGLMFEAYRMDELVLEDCRTIFLDWALGVPAGEDMRAGIEELLAFYAPSAPDHPMNRVLRDGLAQAAGPKRRGGRAARH